MVSDRQFNRLQNVLIVLGLIAAAIVTAHP